MNKLIYLLALVMVVSGCATVSQVTAPNRANLLSLSIGMSKAEALSIMGTETVTGYYSKMTSYKGSVQVPIVINNPYRSEILQGDEKTLEVIYYVTDIKGDESTITDDELTPLVFDEGRLLGWGNSFLDSNIEKYEIRLR